MVDGTDSESHIPKATIEKRSSGGRLLSVGFRAKIAAQHTYCAAKSTESFFATNQQGNELKRQRIERPRLVPSSGCKRSIETGLAGSNFDEMHWLSAGNTINQFMSKPKSTGALN